MKKGGKVQQKQQENVDNRALFVQEQKRLKDMFTFASEGKLEELKAKLNEIVASGKAEDPELSIKKIVDSTKEGSGRTLTFFAASHGHLHIVEFLLSEGADPNILDAEENNLLFVATIHDHPNVCKCLVDVYGLDVNTKKKNGNSTVLHHAAQNDCNELIQYYVEKGANVDEPSDLGSPIEWAVMNGQLDAAAALLKLGASPDGAVLENRTMPPPLIMATSTKETKIVKLLLENNADVNIKDHMGWNSLHCAAEYGFNEIGQLLIENGIDVNYKHENQTALDLAYINYQFGAVSLLRSRTVGGSQFEITEEEGEKKKKEEEAKKTITDENIQKANEKKEVGNQHFAKGEYEEAIKAYDEALSLDSTNAVFNSNKSACLSLLKRFDEALVEAHLAKLKRPGWIKACFREGEAYEGLKNWGDAAASYWEALQFEPSNHEIKRCFDRCMKIGKKEAGNPN